MEDDYEDEMPRQRNEEPAMDKMCIRDRDKQRRFERLLKAQDEIVAEKQAAYQGRKLRLLVDGNAKGSEYPFTARTEGNLLVCVRGDDIKIGEFIEAEIEKTSLRCLFAHKL